MANYTDTIGFVKGTAGYYAAPSGFSPIIRQEVTLDFATIVAARSAAGATALAADDTLEVLRLPAYSRILCAGIEVLEAETTNTTGTLDLGIVGTDVDAWADGVAINATGVSQNGIQNDPANATLAGQYIGSSDDTLDLTFLTAVPTDAVIRVFAYLLPLETLAS